MSADLHRLMAGIGAILLDFDGPVCSIFANYPAPKVAAELVDVLRRRGVDVPPDLASEPDPLEVLRRTGATGDQDATRAVEDALCAAERRAVETAEPTPYGREVIVAARQAGVPVAVVSNNSADAVTAYLTAHRLAGYVSPVVGRVYAKPARMKPHPEPVLDAVRALGAIPSDCVLIGDSLSDIEGARAAGASVIGYANRPSKEDAFRMAGADAVITCMGMVAEALMERP
ncbi:haloacid dehalogenase superfamily, subfamily IA, variant 3 with third motif having DD or ED/haloacid dehalogenase superfamily, subfamily IA, variant 1 with third motif having Dx(3-4)D or Dx(3-4)E [Micromonospora pallida]|uniref:Haloacid dehalogenase superfamily, subfamily IA, variant 3 with third motif having DD or ED/haloacid dehalogenase superfamily, subfamily IA, variant 1 with third motif having Dx(3-4)D or Dx(3-4)E n=1 Tax=Micromonospora pallida TaxID=145854 RepID=A0A1C6TC49_9ACTN|nr:HAD family phosphatase [Micromonospora pallida]SCL39237.1 haloacid dehalogenase superfamily, subfamily IA, variant 3 with third motif having DD or ED/haloacid dehalogenase superfamily, subfamily IA, variant 1 with third motif having Dx(3-4)D or Dx(3-4)E [Micromonospora pallida]